jgi:hypothetical protein
MRMRRILIPLLIATAAAMLALPAVGVAHRAAPSTARAAKRPATTRPAKTKATAKPKKATAKPKKRYTAPTGRHAFVTGFSSNDVGMFTTPLFTALHTTIARYIAPYDAATDATDTANFVAWATAARADHQSMLVSFYHSEGTPARFHIPSVSTYTADVKKFIALAKPFGVTQYQPWNEVNRGALAGAGGFVSPNAKQSAMFYKALLGACRGCTIVGLDVEDNPNYKPTITYIHAFEAELKKLRVKNPHIWGLHNYSDVNRLSSVRTKGILTALPRGAQVWLTETGGIVTLASRHYGDAHAGKVVVFTFKVAGTFKQITRVYLYTWQAAIPPNTRFDAGVLDLQGSPRPAYVAACDQLLGTTSAVCTAAAAEVDSTQ